MCRQIKRKQIRLSPQAQSLWLARGNAGKVNFASGGTGTSTHLNGELMNQATGLNVTHVPYKGSAPAIQDLIGGQTQLLIDAGSVLLPQVKGGKLKALAVTGPKRDPPRVRRAATRAFPYAWCCSTWMA